MSRGPLTFKQSDVTRAVKAVTATGMTVARVEIGRDGKIIVVIGNALEQTADLRGELDRELEELEARHGKG